MRVAYLFAEKRTSQAVSSVAFVPSKDVETAKGFLAELSFDEMPQFIDYSLGEASRTNFDVKTLGGIKQYLAGYLALKKRRIADKTRAAGLAAERREENERQEYDRARRQEGERLFNALPDEEQAVIEKLAAQRSASFDGTLRDQMLAFNRVRFTIERHESEITSYEEWKRRR